MKILSKLRYFVKLAIAKFLLSFSWNKDKAYLAAYTTIIILLMPNDILGCCFLHTQNIHRTPLQFPLP